MIVVNYQGTGEEGSHLVPLLVGTARRMESKHRTDLIDLGLSLSIGSWMEPACFNFVYGPNYFQQLS